jgi:hypothetical protein
MSDLKRLTKDATTKAAISVGREAARCAVGDLLSSEGESKATTEDTSRSRARRWKVGLVVGLGLLVVLGLVGLVLSYWLWFLGAGLLGLGGLFGWWRIRRRFTGKKEIGKATEPVAAKVERVRVAPVEPVAALHRAESAPGAHASEEASEENGAAQEQAIEEELAAMKARLGR